jgi:midasin (ATPase involved in ribosome maturation)
MLYEKGDLNYIERHPDFRIVACMNPANDSGKKPLPPNLADKFTTIVMSDPSKADIEMMTKELCPQLNPCEISELYLEIKKTKTISLRNLSRALGYINRNR